MSSVDNKFTKTLKHMLKELESRDKESVMNKAVDFKLDRSLDYYMEDLKKTCEYIVGRNAFNMLKAIDKYVLEEKK